MSDRFDRQTGDTHSPGLLVCLVSRNLFVTQSVSVGVLTHVCDCSVISVCCRSLACACGSKDGYPILIYEVRTINWQSWIPPKTLSWILTVYMQTHMHTLRHMLEMIVILRQVSQLHTTVLLNWHERHKPCACLCLPMGLCFVDPGAMYMFVCVHGPVFRGARCHVHVCVCTWACVLWSQVPCACLCVYMGLCFVDPGAMCMFVCVHGPVFCGSRCHVHVCVCTWACVSWSQVPCACLCVYMGLCFVEPGAMCMFVCVHGPVFCGARCHVHVCVCTWACVLWCQVPCACLCVYMGLCFVEPGAMCMFVCVHGPVFCGARCHVHVCVCTWACVLWCQVHVCVCTWACVLWCQVHVCVCTWACVLWCQVHVCVCTWACILWCQVPSGKLKQELHGHFSLVYDLSWSRKDTHLLSASADGTVRLEVWILLLLSPVL